MGKSREQTESPLYLQDRPKEPHGRVQAFTAQIMIENEEWLIPQSNSTANAPAAWLWENFSWGSHYCFSHWPVSIPIFQKEQQNTGFSRVFQLKYPSTWSKGFENWSLNFDVNF